jgi:outer membrane protein assembly factor BamE
MQKLLIPLLLVGTSLQLTACPSSLVHKIDIQQGNVIDQEMVNKLEPGMDKSQVRFVLGTPPLIDPFHQERWDYVYTYQPGGEEREQRHLSLYFDRDRLARIEGDVTPAAGEAPEQVAKETTVVVVPADQKKAGFFRGLKDSIGLGSEDEFVKTPDSAKTQPEQPEDEGAGAADPIEDETTGEPAAESADTPAL